METRQKLETTLKDAMRSGDELRRQNLRMVISAIKFNEIEKRTPLDEAGVIAIIQKEIKSRQESLADAEKANRPELVERAKAEMTFLETFLPKQLGEDELTAIANETIAEIGAKTPADMGKVMKAMMPKVQGRAAGDQVSAAVRKLLQS